MDEYRAGLLPEDKVRIVRNLEGQEEHVAYLGDGVNDAPALAATVGIAMERPEPTWRSWPTISRGSPLRSASAARLTAS